MQVRGLCSSIGLVLWEARTPGWETKQPIWTHFHYKLLILGMPKYRELWLPARPINLSCFYILGNIVKQNTKARLLSLLFATFQPFGFPPPAPRPFFSFLGLHHQSIHKVSSLAKGRIGATAPGNARSLTHLREARNWPHGYQWVP